MNELVSVIVPVFNRQDTILRSLQSIRNQSYENLEIIVVDDASTDDSVRIVESIDDPRISIARHKKNMGANAARNTGIRMAKGTILAFNDSDDEWYDNKLDIQLDYMREGGYSVVFSPYIRIRDNVSEMIPNENTIQRIRRGDLLSILKKINVIGTPTLILRRDTIDEVGLFDEQLPRFQDYDYAIRLSKKYDIGFYENPTVNAYIMNDSITMDESKSWAGLVRIYMKHKDHFGLDWLVGHLINMQLFSETPSINVDELMGRLSKCCDNIEELYSEIVRVLSERINGLLYDREMIWSAKKRYLETGNFAIYGAGESGKQIYLKLKAQGFYPTCFIVSQAPHENARIDEIDVIGLDDYLKVDDLIIIAANPVNREQILENLESRKLYNYCFA